MRLILEAKVDDDGRITQLKGIGGEVIVNCENQRDLVEATSGLTGCHGKHERVRPRG